MGKSGFKRRTDHYDDQFRQLDERICALLKERKELSAENSGFPSDEVISEWAEKYGLYEDYLKSIFGSISMESYFKPKVEPKEFIKHVPISSSVVKGEKLYTLTAIRQYKNASVVMLHVDWDEPDRDPRDHHHHQYFELHLDGDYDCRNDGGSGSKGYFNHRYIVSPPLPDNLSGQNFVFQEFEDHFMGSQTGHEIVFQME